MTGVGCVTGVDCGVTWDGVGDGGWTVRLLG